MGSKGGGEQVQAALKPVRLAERLTDAALSVLHHDGDEDGEPVKLERGVLMERFLTILVDS